MYTLETVHRNSNNILIVIHKSFFVENIDNVQLTSGQSYLLKYSRTVEIVDINTSTLNAVSRHSFGDNTNTI